MPAPTTHCDHDLLRRSLDDVLTEQQEETLAAHLAECAECRDRLEELAGRSDEWSRIERVLRNETTGVVDPARQIVSTLIPRDASARSHGSEFFDADLKPHDFAVDFLEPSDNADALGRVDNIEVRSIIGHGGNGIVLKGFQEELNRLVAVKVMAPQLATSAAARRRFAREAQATAAIVHPNVMPILTVNSSGQLPFIVMPYVDCESLQDRLDRTGSLTTLDILRIGLQVAKGLAAAHAQGLVHRDVKPANILLERGVDRVMLTDFGLARAVDDATLTRTGLIAGTPQYMSPEQARGEAVDTRSDLFSLGSVLYALATGRPPFRAETSYGILRRVTDHEARSIRELNSEIPDWLEGIVNKLLAKTPDERFSSSASVAQLLEDCVAHVQQPNASSLPDEVKSLVPARKRMLDRWPWLVAGLLLAVIAVAAGIQSLDIAGEKNEQNSNAAVSSNSAPAPPTFVAPPVDGTDAWNAGIDAQLNELDGELDVLMQSLENME